MKPTSEVHNIDCMEFMRGLPDKFFDLAVADPPYGLQGGKKTGLVVVGYIQGQKLNLAPDLKWGEITMGKNGMNVCRATNFLSSCVVYQSIKLFGAQTISKICRLVGVQ